MMSMFYLIMLMAFGVVSAVAQSKLSFMITESNPEESSRTVMQCDAKTNGSQIVAINKGDKPISWNGVILPNFGGGESPARFIVAQETNLQGTLINLTIQTVCTEDQGTYNCNIYDTTDGGSSYVVLQSSVELSVREYDSSDLCNPSGAITALRGDQLDLICSWRSERASLNWMDSTGTPIDSVISSGNLQDSVSAKFNINVTDDLDGAMYHCSAAVTACSPAVRTCTVGPITVISEPRVTVSYTENSIVLGGSATFLCTVLPNAWNNPPTVTWHTAPPLQANRALFSSSGAKRMYLAQIFAEDEGRMVYCTATFENGKSAMGEFKVIISPNDTGTNGIIGSTNTASQTTPDSISTEETPVTSPASTPKQPFLLFGSYPVTVAIVSSGSIFVALLLALVVFCCCRGRKKRQKRRHEYRPPPLSPRTFVETMPGHIAPGGITDPDEQWGATPGISPSRATTVNDVDTHGYQEPVTGGSINTHVYTQVHPESPTFSSNPYMETNIDSPDSEQYFEISPPNGMVGDALYQASGEYVEPELTDQAKVDREMCEIRVEKQLSAPSGPATAGYLAIGEVPDKVRAANSRDMNTHSAVYMEIT